MTPPTTYTAPLDSGQAKALKQLLERENFNFSEKPYALFSAARGKLNVTVYEKGPKVLVQGKDTGDFVQFYLEPEILGEARMGYEEVHHPERYTPHFGIDESGKGDFFGPLVIAGVYVDGEIARSLAEAGIQDSKRITSDARIRQLAAAIRKTRGIAYEVIAIGPARYNEMYARIGNLNRLLAWGHARVIENLCEKRPECPRALSDQFANPREIERALKDKGRQLEMEQRTKAESDPAVAAASILARERFIDWLRDQGEALGIPLPRGASGQVKEVAARIVLERGAAELAEYCKMHFKTAAELI
jgi:ribonuclease HIII